MCTLLRCTRYSPHEGNSTALAEGQREKASPRLTTKSLTRPPWIPAILRLQGATRRDVDTHIVSVNGGTVYWARYRPRIIDGGVMYCVARRINSHLIVQSIDDKA